MAVDRLQTFLDLAASAPPERDARHFQTWQRVSVRVQREVRSLAAQNFFAEESRAAADLDRAFTMVVYSCCQPCYGQRPMEFTYDIGELVSVDGSAAHRTIHAGAASANFSGDAIRPSAEAPVSAGMARRHFEGGQEQAANVH